MSDGTIARESEGARVVLRVGGTFDRSTAWALRERIEAESAPEVVIDLSGVRDFSDVGAAVLAVGMQGAHRARVLFRGLRQHQLRILRYCGVAVEEVGFAGSAPSARAGTPVPADPAIGHA